MAKRVVVKEKAIAAFDTVFYRKGLKAEIAALKKSITKLREDIERQKKEASAQIKAADEMAARLTESNKTLEAQIVKNQAAAADAIQECKRIVQEKETHLGNLGRLLEEKRNEIQQLEDRLVTEAAKLQRALDEQRVALSTQRTALEREHKEKLETQTEIIRGRIVSLERERKGIIADNEKHVATIKQMQDVLAKQKEIIKKMKEDLDRLKAPANVFAVFDKMINKDEAEVWYRGERRIVTIQSDCTISQGKFGHTVILDGGANSILEFRDEPAMSFGEECTFLAKHETHEDHIRVTTNGEVNRVVRAAYTVDIAALKVGDHLLYDPKSGIVFATLPKLESDKAIEEEIPNVSFEDIGGHEAIIKEIVEQFTYPFLYSDRFLKMKKPLPKGALLHGPPGNGKTMIAKALGFELVKRGFLNETGQKQKAKFFTVGGPEIQDKYIGEGERKLRELYARARAAAEDGYLALIFFDEIDSLFPLRGSGISSDVEKTMVAQMTVLMDGIKEIKNIIVIGATNRPELLDPAILRDGRLDLSFYIPRPNESAARKIFSIYLEETLPFHEQYYKDGPFVYYDCFAPQSEWELGKEGKRCEVNLDKDPKKIVQYFIDRIIARTFWANGVVRFMTSGGKQVVIDNRFVELIFREGDSVTYYLRDFLSGAMFKGIMDRAKQKAIVEDIEAQLAAEAEKREFTSKMALRIRHFLDAIEESFREKGELPNTANPNEWTRLVGDGKREVANVRVLQGRKSQAEEAAVKENALPGEGTSRKRGGGGGGRVI